MSIKLIMQDLKKLDDLLILCLHMAHLLNEENLDPSYFSVFRDILNEWMEHAKGPGLFVFASHVHSELHGLSASVKLSTGISMSVIWQEVHPTVPSNLQQWQVYDHLSAVMTDFENKTAFQIGKRLLFRHK
jgi:midasin (ATPase involved in ribosome maturation)